MNNRLVWNFEINSNSPLQLPKPVAATDNHKHWETRFFWDESPIITLFGLEKTFLELSRYKIKHRVDTYLLLPDEMLNFKIRHQQFFYKPLIERTSIANAFGKKISLDEHSSSLIPLKEKLNKSVSIIEHLQLHGQSIEVEKEAMIYKFPSHPSTKLELARLVIDNNIFFSTSIESPDFMFVKQVAEQMLPQQTPSDYVTFLKKTIL